MVRCNLVRNQTALLVVDVQEKLFSVVDRGPEVLANMLKVIKGFQILHIPIFVSEQYPKGLGSTVSPLKTALGDHYQPWEKTTFSCMDDFKLRKHLQDLPYRQWILIGIEAHVCVLQTGKGLLRAGKEVVVLNDAMTSRSIYDFSTAIAEMRDEGFRISCTETVLFELIHDSQSPEFKQISQLVKVCCDCQASSPCCLS
jgi:nicotinamidase-related amidase